MMDLVFLSWVGLIDAAKVGSCCKYRRSWKERYSSTNYIIVLSQLPSLDESLVIAERRAFTLQRKYI